MNHYKFSQEDKESFINHYVVSTVGSRDVISKGAISRSISRAKAAIQGLEDVQGPITLGKVINCMNRNGQHSSHYGGYKKAAKAAVEYFS